jgi:hypothetical protein
MSSSSPSIEDLIRDGRALLEKATCEGWVAQGCDVRRYYMHFDHRMAYASTPDNASFIAWSRNNLPALLDALERANTCWDHETQRADALRAEMLAARGLAQAVQALACEVDKRSSDLTFRVAREIDPAVWRRLVEKFQAWRAARGEGTK